VKQMLVVVDYQVDFVDGSLGFPEAKLLDEGIAALVRSAAAKGDYILYTMDTHGGDYLNSREGKSLPVVHCVETTIGWALYGEASVALGEAGAMELKKTTFGVAPADMLDLPEDVEQITLVGLVSNICVISNACVFQARYPQAQVVVVRDLCASFDPALHEKTMDVLTGLQVQVVKKEAVL